jgi:Family of unknown function (DUF6152)
MNTKLVAFFLLAGILAVCLPMSAHHGNAAYDMKEVVLKGATVTSFSWANPHCIVTFDVKDDKGNVAHWASELGSPSAISLVGWTKTSIKPGDVITIYIHQSKTNNRVGRISHILLADGTPLPKPGASQDGGEENSSY